MGGGVLLILSFLFSTANAKSLPLISTSCSVSFTDDLSDRLAADKDFQEFSISIYNLVSKVQETKSGKLFVSYFQKNISESDRLSLLKNLGYSSNDGFMSFLHATFQNKIAFNKKFPELLSDENAIKIVTKASKTVVEAAIKPNKLTPADCWMMLSGLLSSCTLYCSTVSDPNCWWECYTAAISLSGTCFLFAD